MEICNKCDCKCKPISINCIIDNSDIEDSETIKDNLYTLATSSIDDLIGEDCAEALCIALETAAEQAQAAQETDIIPYLDEKWKNVVQNKYFISWYAYKIQWHFLNGPSISEIAASRLITVSESDPDYKNDFQSAQEAERKRLERSTARRVAYFKDKFKKRYWNKNIDLYDCAEKECGCKKDYLCKQHCKEDKQDGIGIWIG